MLSQKLVRGSLFVGTLVPSPARPARQHLNHHPAEAESLEHARAETATLRQRLTEQSKRLRHTSLLLDATRAENAAMRKNIAELMRARIAPLHTAPVNSMAGAPA